MKDANAIPLLVICLTQREISLKRIAANALSEVAKHSPELAKLVVEAGALPYLSNLINHTDNYLKRHVCNCLT